jgi:hypothetical protein
VASSDYNLDPSGFSNGMMAATSATVALQGSLSSLTSQSGLAQRALNGIMPLASVGVLG